MKKLLLLFVMAVAVFTACRKENRCIKGNGKTVTETRNVSEFHSIYLNGSLDLIVTQDSTQQLKIEGAENIVNEITTNVAGGELHIESERCFRNPGKITIYANVKTLKKLELNGSGEIKTQNTFSVQDIELYLNGSGKLNISSEANSVNAKINGSGDVVLKGNANSQTLAIIGSGNINSFEMPVKTAVANIEGSGKIEVNATENLDVNITGSGSVIYMGSPIINKSISGSGSVKSR